jgi:hypothetical protein
MKELNYTNFSAFMRKHVVTGLNNGVYLAAYGDIYAVENLVAAIDNERLVNASNKNLYEQVKGDLMRYRSLLQMSEQEKNDAVNRANQLADEVGKKDMKITRRDKKIALKNIENAALQYTNDELRTENNTLKAAKTPAVGPEKASQTRGRYPSFVPQEAQLGGARTWTFNGSSLTHSESGDQEVTIGFNSSDGNEIRIRVDSSGFINGASHGGFATIELDGHRIPMALFMAFSDWEQFGNRYAEEASSPPAPTVTNGFAFAYEDGNLIVVDKDGKKIDEQSVGAYRANSAKTIADRNVELDKLCLTLFGAEHYEQDCIEHYFYVMNGSIADIVGNLSDFVNGSSVNEVVARITAANAAAKYEIMKNLHWSMRNGKFNTIEEHCQYLKNSGKADDADALVRLFKDRQNAPIVSAIISSLNEDKAFLAAKPMDTPSAPAAEAKGTNPLASQLTSGQIGGGSDFNSLRAIQLISDMRLSQNGVNVPYIESTGMTGGAKSMVDSLSDEKELIINRANALKTRFNSDVVSKLDSYITRATDLEKEVRAITDKTNNYLNSIQRGDTGVSNGGIDMGMLNQLNDQNVNANMKQLKTVYKVHTMLGNMYASVEEVAKKSKGSADVRL